MSCSMLAIMALLGMVVAQHAAQLPSWSAHMPDPSKPMAGYDLLGSTTHTTIYNASHTYGTYNHGPIITMHEGVFYCNWYNGVQDESVNNRVVFSTSTDGLKWTEPAEMFPFFAPNNASSGIGLENEPFVVIEDRLYAVAGSWDVFQRTGPGAEGTGPVAPLVRRVFNASTLGPIFWLAEAAPKGYEYLEYPLYSDMDSITAKDMVDYMSMLVNTAPSSDYGQPNERSLYALPGDPLQLILLLRAGSSGAPSTMLASRCALPPSSLSASLAPLDPPPSIRQCRPGTGLIQYDMPWPPSETMRNPVGRPDIVGSMHCNWTAPAYTTIPDSHSRTCTSPLPDGRIYMVGAQLTTGRDPLVLSVSSDGLVFDHAWAVRADAPPMRYPGKAKGPGFQYPGGLYVNSTLYISYSINKEDIAVTALPLAVLG